jgi:hypothetical protein
MPTISILGRRLAVSLLLVMAGCGDAQNPADTLPRNAVSGSVALDGKPLAQGKIQFAPVDAGSGKAAFAVGDITDGKYAIDQAAGPVAGKFKVSISSVPSIKISTGEPGPVPKMEPEKVPTQFNTKTTLTKEVTSGPNTIDFELKSK